MSPNRHTLSDPNDPGSSTLGEDCRARPGYYTDGQRNQSDTTVSHDKPISDEIVEKATRAYIGSGVCWTDPRPEIRTALESVLPDIERPLRKRIEILKWDAQRHYDRATEAGNREGAYQLRAQKAEALLAERDKEIERLNGNLHELRDQRNDAERRVIERDKEIERLRSSENKEIVRLTRERDEWQATAEALEDPLSRETLLEGENKEIERLTERLEAADLRYEGALRWVRTMSERLGSEHAFPPDEIEALLWKIMLEKHRRRLTGGA